MYAVKIFAEHFEELGGAQSEELETETTNPISDALAQVAESKQTLEEATHSEKTENTDGEGNTSGQERTDPPADSADSETMKTGVDKLSAMLREDTFDRNAFDKVLHDLQWNADCLRRDVLGAHSLTQHHRERMAFHVDELVCQQTEVQKHMRRSAPVPFEEALRKFQATIDHIHENHIEKTSFRRWAPISYPDEGTVPHEGPLPWPLIIAVTIDAGVDGLLCGLAYVAKPQAGIIMAFATCIEVSICSDSYAHD